MYNLRKSLLLPAAILLALMLTDCSGKKGSGTPGILVSSQWLQEHLNDPDLVIFHSGSAALFDTLHIPGARLIDPYQFAINNEKLRNEMPPADSIVAMLRKLGVEKDSRIVLYSESTRLLSRTARVFVALDHIGLGERTFLLNGGLPAWQEEGGICTDEAANFEPGILEMQDLKKVLIEVVELDQTRWSDTLVVIDARTAEEYYGTPGTLEEAAEGGHVEGAYLLPYQDLLSDEKSDLFKSDTELRELFRTTGMDSDRVTVVYCGSGIRASVSYLAAKHLGYPVLLYDGSYEEWDELDMPLTGPVSLLHKNE